MIEMLLLGFLGSSHCLGMCSGFVIALRGRDLPYHAGRLTTYSAMGALAATLGHTLLPPRWALVGAGLVMVWMGLGLLGWAPKPRGPRLGFLALRLASLMQRGNSFGLGLATGFLPCGLLYAALVRATAAPGPMWGALFMACFWAGTLPALLGVRWMRGRLPWLAGAGAILAGLLTVAHGLTPEPCCSCD